MENKTKRNYTQINENFSYDHLQLKVRSWSHNLRQTKIWDLLIIYLLIHFEVKKFDFKSRTISEPYQVKPRYMRNVQLIALKSTVFSTAF